MRDALSDKPFNVECDTFNLGVQAGTGTHRTCWSKMNNMLHRWICKYYQSSIRIGMKSL